MEKMRARKVKVASLQALTMQRGSAIAQHPVVAAAQQGHSPGTAQLLKLLRHEPQHRQKLRC
jgi:hypothetical protein